MFQCLLHDDFCLFFSFLFRTLVLIKTYKNADIYPCFTQWGGQGRPQDFFHGGPIHRRSQDFLNWVHFSSKKLMTILVIALETQAKTTK